MDLSLLAICTLLTKECGWEWADVDMGVGAVYPSDRLTPPPKSAPVIQG